jgi:catechol 2,3-dioxygenase
MSRPPAGPHVNHVVLTVRDIEASHQFYTELLGFQRCGVFEGENCPTQMWFYRGSETSHHDFALVEAVGGADMEPAGDWPGFFPERISGLNHLAIGYGSRDEWLERVRVLQSAGVPFLVRGNHGMTHSAYVADPDGHGIEVLYDLPAAVWEGDVNAALSYFEHLPTEGDEALIDPTEYPTFG